MPNNKSLSTIALFDKLLGLFGREHQRTELAPAPAKKTILPSQEQTSSVSGGRKIRIDTGSMLGDRADGRIGTMQSALLRSRPRADFDGRTAAVHDLGRSPALAGLLLAGRIIDYALHALVMEPAHFRTGIKISDHVGPP